MFKKHSFERAMARMAWKLVGYQLVAMFIYVIMTLVVMVIFADEDGYVYPWNEVYATLLTEIVVLTMAYKPLWMLGDDHAGSLKMAHTRGTKYSGLQVGLLAIFSLNFSLFTSILGYMLYPWEPYFNICKLYMDISAWYMPLIYVPTILPMPILCHIAYTNGVKGVTLKKTIRNYQAKRAAKASAQKM